MSCFSSGFPPFSWPEICQLRYRVDASSEPCHLNHRFEQPFKRPTFGFSSGQTATRRDPGLGAQIHRRFAPQKAEWPPHNTLPPSLNMSPEWGTPEHPIVTSASKRAKLQPEARSEARSTQIRHGSRPKTLIWCSRPSFRLSRCRFGPSAGKRGKLQREAHNEARNARIGNGSRRKSWSLVRALPLPLWAVGRAQNCNGRPRTSRKSFSHSSLSKA